MIFVEHPESETIAAMLESVGATLCEHGNNPCVMRCGVRCDVSRLPDTVVEDPPGYFTSTPNYRKTGPWTVIPYTVRRDWMTRVFEKFASVAARHREEGGE